MKKCNDCGVEKPRDQFYKRRDNKNPNSVVSRCKECEKIYYKKRATSKEYRDRMVKNSIEWQKNNPLRSRYLQAKSNALNKSRRRSLEFQLSFEQIVDLWHRGCHYCSKDIINNKGVGLDRIDNSEGYIITNVVPCCGDCNIIKNTLLTVKEMEVAMKAVLKYRSSGK